MKTFGIAILGTILFLLFLGWLLLPLIISVIMWIEPSTLGLLICTIWAIFWMVLLTLITKSYH